MPLSTIDKVFTETQKYNEPWIRYATILLSIFFGVGLVYCLAVPTSEVSGDIGIGLFAGAGIMLIACIIVFFKTLTIKIDEHGIMFKEKPAKVEAMCRWEDIDQVLFCYYKNGIWGVRSSAKNGMAYNLRAKAGIQIILKNGEKAQLGIQKIKEARAIIEHYLKQAAAADNAL